MIEAYLRANRMFVDYKEVIRGTILQKYATPVCNFTWLFVFVSSISASTRKSIFILFAIRLGRCWTLCVRSKEVNISTFLESHLAQFLVNCQPVSNGTSFLCRPHDRVPLKEMKADWHYCLDSKVGFKVSF